MQNKKILLDFIGDFALNSYINRDGVGGTTNCKTNKTKREC